MPSVETNLYYPDDMTIEKILNTDLTTLERLRQTERHRKLQADPFTDDITPLSHMPAGRRIFKILRAPKPDADLDKELRSRWARKGKGEGKGKGELTERENAIMLPFIGDMISDTATLYFKHSQRMAMTFPEILTPGPTVTLSKVSETQGAFNAVGIYECDNEKLPHKLIIRIGMNGTDTNTDEWVAEYPGAMTGGNSVTDRMKEKKIKKDTSKEVTKLRRRNAMKREGDKQRFLLGTNMYGVDNKYLADELRDNFVTAIRDFSILPNDKDGQPTLTPFDISEKIWMFANYNDICPKIYLYDYVKGNNGDTTATYYDYHVFHACMISEAYNMSLQEFYKQGGKLEELQNLPTLAAEANILKQIDNKVGQQLAECYGKLIDKGIFCVDVNPGNIVIKFNEDPEISADTLLTSITVRLIDLDNDYCYLNYKTLLGKDFKESDVDKGEIHFYIKILTLMQLANVCLFQFQKNFLVDEIKKLIANHISISDMEENNIENECKNLYCKLLQHFKKGGKHDSFLKRTKKYSKIDDGYVNKEILEKSPEGIIERKLFAEAKTYDATGLPKNEKDLLELRFDNSTTDPELVFEYMWINAFKRTPDDTSVSETTGDCSSSTLEEKGEGDNKKLGAKADIGQCNLAARTKRAFKKSDRLNKTRKRMSDSLSDTRTRMKASKMPKMNMPKMKMPNMDIGPVGPSAHQLSSAMGQMTSAALFGY